MEPHGISVSPPRVPLYPRVPPDAADSEEAVTPHPHSWAWSRISQPIGPYCPRPPLPLALVGHAPHPHWPGLAPPHAEVPRPAGPWRSAAMALVLALLSQALARVWRSPGSSARHAPPSRAMEHDRAIEVYGDCTGRGGSPGGGPGLALGS